MIHGFAHLRELEVVEKQCNPDATATGISLEMLQVDARKF